MCAVQYQHKILNELKMSVSVGLLVIIIIIMYLDKAKLREHSNQAAIVKECSIKSEDLFPLRSKKVHNNG